MIDNVFFPDAKIETTYVKDELVEKISKLSKEEKLRILGIIEKELGIDKIKVPSVLPFGDK